MVSSIFSINQSIIQHAGHNAGYNYNIYLFASKTFCLNMCTVKWGDLELWVTKNALVAQQP